MINAKKILMILMSGGIFLVSVPALYFLAAETCIWAFEGDAEAEVKARRVFLRVCDEQGFNEADFHRPIRNNVEVDEKNGIRSYAWLSKCVSNFITMSYLPSDIQYSIEVKDCYRWSMEDLIVILATHVST